MLNDPIVKEMVKILEAAKDPEIKNSPEQKFLNAYIKTLQEEPAAPNAPLHTRTDDKEPYTSPTQGNEKAYFDFIISDRMNKFGAIYQTLVKQEVLKFDANGKIADAMNKCADTFENSHTKDKGLDISEIRTDIEPDYKGPGPGRGRS